MINRSATTVDFRIGHVAAELAEELAHLEPTSPNEPAVIFKSDLVLTRPQEDALCEHARRWYERLDDQLGRGISESSSGFPAFLSGERGDRTRATSDKFMCKRVLYQLSSENDVNWRAYMMPDSIFGTSNLTMPLSRRIAKQSAARAVNYFFGTDPWFAQYPIGAQDTELARKLEKLTNLKFESSGSLGILRRAVSNVFNIGEAVLKTTHTVRKKRYKEMAVVAVQDGLPILALDGLPIKEDDDWTMPDPLSGVEVLMRDGQTPKPPVLDFQQQLIDQEMITYSGPEVTQIYFRDFMCPENAKDVQSAECIIHMMERTAGQLAELVLSGSQDMESLRNAVDAIQDALSGDFNAKTGDRGPRTELGQEDQIEGGEPVTEYGEFYLHFDADGDGVSEDIMLIMNPVTGAPIYYNYVCNLTPDGLRPFQVITSKPVMNRWYGQGIYEEYATHQMSVDLLLNRRNLNQSGSGRVVFWNKSATVEGDANPDLKMNWGQSYSLKPGMGEQDAVKVVYIDDNKFERLTEELQFHIQTAMNESGVQNTNDAQAAGLDTAELATGIRNIEKSGQEMFSLPISELELGITDVTNAFVNVLYGNLEDAETFSYFEGEVPVEITVEKADVKHLRFDIRVLLTRYREEQKLASYGQGILSVKDFLSLQPMAQMIMAPLFEEQLRALQIPNPERYTQVQPFPLTAPGSGDAAADPSAAPKTAPLSPQPNI